MAHSAFKLMASGSDGKSIRDTKVQLNHGFLPGDVIRYNVPLDGSAEGWTAAVGTSPIEAEVAGIVESITGTDEFTVVYQGEISLSNISGITTAGEDVFFLSDVNPGKMQTSAPTSGGHVIKPVLTRIDPAIGIVTNYIGTTIGGRATVSLDAVQPTGTIMPYAGNPAFIPDTWSMCDGQHLDAVQYQELFDRIGTTYGFRQTLFFGDEVDGIFGDDGPDLNTTVSQVLENGDEVQGTIVSDSWNPVRRSVVLQVFDTQTVEKEGSRAYAEVPEGRRFQVERTIVLHKDEVPQAVTPISAPVTEFRKPDLRGRTILGLSEGIPYPLTVDGLYMESFLENDTGFEKYILGEKGGEEEHVLTLDELARHIHNDTAGHPGHPGGHPHPDEHPGHPGGHPHQIPHTTDGSPLPHTTEFSPIPHTSEGSPIPHTSEGSPIPHTSEGSPIPHTSEGSPIPHTSFGSPAPHPVSTKVSSPGISKVFHPDFTKKDTGPPHLSEHSNTAHPEPHTEPHTVNHGGTIPGVSQVNTVTPTREMQTTGLQKKERALGGGGMELFSRDQLQFQRALNIVSPTPAPSDLIDNQRAFAQAKQRSVKDMGSKPDWMDAKEWEKYTTGEKEAPFPLTFRTYSEGGQRAYGGFDEDGFVGNDSPHNNMQPYLALNYIIKVNSTARAAFVDGLDLSLNMNNLTDVEEDAVYENGDLLIYHGGQEPELKNKWKAFRLFDGWTSDVDILTNQGFKFFMPGASGSAVGEKGAFTIGAQLSPQHDNSVMAAYGDIELGPFSNTFARLIEGINYTSSTPPNYLQMNGNGTENITVDSHSGIDNVIDSMTAKDPNVFGQDVLGSSWTVGRGGMGGGLSGASSDGEDGTAKRKYEEIFRITDTGRIGLLTDGAGLDSTAGPVYGSGYGVHTGLHLNGGLRLRRGEVVVDGITTDISETHALEDNEVPTSGAVRDYVDEKFGSVSQAGTIRAMASGIFLLNDIITAGGTAMPGGTVDGVPEGSIEDTNALLYTIDLNNLSSNTEKVAGSAMNYGTFASDGTTAAFMVSVSDMETPATELQRVDRMRLWYRHRDEGQHNLVDVYAYGANGSDDGHTDDNLRVQIFAQQINQS